MVGMLSASNTASWSVTCVAAVFGDADEEVGVVELVAVAIEGKQWTQ